MVIFCIPCLVLVAYFLIASIFIPRYRTYIKEGWRCFADKLRGKECSVSFDNKMRLVVSEWFAGHGMPRLGKFLYKKKNFDWTLITVGIVTTVLTVYLVFVAYQFWFVEPPCTEEVCGI
jgi:hypothetical protein